MALFPTELWSTMTGWLLPLCPSCSNSHQSDPDPVTHLKGRPTSRETKGKISVQLSGMCRKTIGLSSSFFSTYFLHETSSWPCSGFSDWWVFKIFSHSALHPFYLKSLNQSATFGTFPFLSNGGQHLHVGVDWEIQQQRWCCALKFPASLSHQGILFSFDHTWERTIICSSSELLLKTSLWPMMSLNEV